MSLISNLFLQRKIYFAALALLLLSGCAKNTEFGGAKISSNPDGAEVVNLKDNSYLGTTPVSVSFPGESGTSEFVTVQFRKPGYLDRITSFWVNKRHKTALDADENAIDINVTLEKRKQN